MPARTANRQIHIYRAGRRFGGGITKCTKGARYMGYFERREFGGITRWHWTWALYASQSRRANEWVYDKLQLFNEQLAA